MLDVLSERGSPSREYVRDYCFFLGYFAYMLSCRPGVSPVYILSAAGSTTYVWSSH